MEGGRTDEGPGDIQHDTAGLLAGEREGNIISLLPAR